MLVGFSNPKLICFDFSNVLEMNSMQKKARDYLASVYNEHEKAAQHLETQRKEFEERERYLDKCQSLNKTELRKLKWQKQKVTFNIILYYYLLFLIKVCVAMIREIF